MPHLRAFVFCLISIVAVPFLAQAQSASPGLFDVVNVASNDVLNIRTSASGSSAKVGFLAYNQQSVEVVALTSDGKWGLVNTDEGSGWVSMRFMQASAASPQNLPSGLACSGTEPFWFLQFSQTGTATADWSPMGLTDQQQSIYSSYWSSRPQNRVTQTYGFELLDELTGSGVMASGIIRTEMCDDGMSDRDYGFAIDLLLFGPERKLLSGCCSISP